MADGLSEPKGLDLAACEDEPIRVPGAIQPHGALIVIDPATLAVRHASANFAAFVGLPLTVGQTLEQAGAAELAAETRRWLSEGAQTLLRTLRVGEADFQVLGHQTPQGVMLEFEEPPRSEAETLEGLYPRLRGFLGAIAQARDVTGIAEAAVKEVRAVTGFNRVMLYSFDANGDGLVLAQDGDGVLPSYMGHRFPGSDIPAQARDLYKLNRLRLIPTADYAPVAVEPATSMVDGKPLDLSHAALRSVSPIHLQYMRNMGTGSSMSISILVEGELWGLISGHSRDPHRVNAQVRTACDILGQVLSLQIEARQQAARTGERLTLKHVETELLAQLAVSNRFQLGLLEHGDLWMALTRADGAAIVSGGEVLKIGAAPPDDFVREIAEALHADEVEVFSSEALTERWPEAAAFATEASGVLAVAISQLHANYILWFRREVVRTVEWAGDPTAAKLAENGWLHPRKSFEVWREQVRERSLPWRDSEIESAESFRKSIQNLVLRRAEERAELTDRLERANKELESFSYSVSHDLRAPFRHIVGFAELLSDREKSLDGKARHYLQSITDSALAAGRLVDDLLSFSQLGRASLTMSGVNMAKLVAEVRRTLDVETAGRRIDWRMGPLPDAWGDASMLRQVWQNLLQNAAKYSAPRETAVIEISGRDEGDRVVYAVRDNGVGFEMAYVKKLFGVFQRLHRVEDFEGTGIGLALVKRIIDRHGGEIAATGTPDQGAEFIFSIPKRPNGPSGATRG